MTLDEVIQAARREAGTKGWPWSEPIQVEEKRRFLLFGRKYWRVTTNTYYAEIGDNVRIDLDNHTGQILRSEYVPTQTSNSAANL